MSVLFDILRSVVYGIIEGITEWLPISSTGHMILAEQVLKFSFSAEFMEMFRVVIQLGAILAVVVMYFKKLWPFCVDNGRDSGLAKHVRWPVMRLWFKIIVACLPAAVLGLALLCTAYGFILRPVAQKYTTPEHVGFLFSLEPVFSAIFGFLFLRERLHPADLCESRRALRRRAAALRLRSAARVHGHRLPQRLRSQRHQVHGG